MLWYNAFFVYTIIFISMNSIYLYVISAHAMLSLVILSVLLSPGLGLEL